MTRVHLHGNKIVRHGAIWIFVWMYLYFSAPATTHWFFQAIGCVFSVLNFSILYYVLFCFIIPYTWKNEKLVIIPSICVLFTFYFCIRWCISGFLMHFVHLNPPPDLFIHVLTVSGLFFIPISIMAFTSYFNQLALDRLRLEKEREKILMYEELDFLKSQFNSHLTFNFLNFLYSKAHTSSERAAEAIGLFSETLRYSLRIAPEKVVSIQEELEHISGFINLQKCLNQDVYFELLCTGNTDQVKILPRILILFVEDAFRNGISRDPDNPIRVVLETGVSSIVFKMKYKKDLRINKLGSIIDLNVKKYLDLYYRERHRLEISEEHEFCSINLFLNC
jgi:two-component system LytT family sensor kinase